MNNPIKHDLFSCSRNYLDFKLAKNQNPSSWVVNVYAKGENLLLGTIKWYWRWRQYSFFTVEDRVFEKKCMADITEMMRRLNVIQRAGIKPKSKKGVKKK